MSVSRRGLLLALLSSACVIRLPPAPPPAPRAPAVDTSAPLAAGHGRLVIDVVDGPAPVQHVRVQPSHDRLHVRFSEVPSPLCTSPCVADLPTGNALIGFPVVGDPGAVESDLVYVDAGTTTYRRQLSQYHARKKTALYTLGIIATTLGGAAAVTGVVLLPIGLSGDNDDLAIGGGITLAAGAALLAAGIWAIRSESPTYRPGSAIHFAP